MDILNEVRQTISKSLDIPMEQLTPDARLEELGAESLDMIEIVFELEEKFNITIPFKSNEGGRPAKPAGEGDPPDAQFSTIGDIANMVKGLVEAKTPG